MTTGELLLIAFVALVVFGPNRLPTLARQLAKFFKRVNHYKQQFYQFLEIQSLTQQLEENQKKAAKADEQYQTKLTEDNLN